MEEDVQKFTAKLLKTLLDGHIAEAEKMLARFEKKASNPNMKRIYQALYGIYYAYVSDDRDALIFKLYSDGDPKETAKEYLEVLKSVNFGLGEEDPFIETWRAVLEMVPNLPTPHKLRQNKQEQP